MVPFFEQPSIDLGPITIHAFGILVATGILIGMQLTLNRAKREGLDPRREEDLIWYALIIGFVISHLFDTIAYYPERIVEDPLVLLRVWDGISSFGGILGGLAGTAFFFWRKAPELSMGERLRYVDQIAYGFPFAWIFGRLGCTVALDHPGTITQFFLGTSLKTEAARDYIWGVYANADALSALPSDEVLAGYGFHNLGFYEFLYTLLVIAPIVYLLGRKRRAPGFFLALFLLVYAPIRFLLDFLRMSDATYLGLTPGQYMATVSFLLGGYLVWRLRENPDLDEKAA